MFSWMICKDQSDSITLKPVHGIIKIFVKAIIYSLLRLESKEQKIQTGSSALIKV